VAHVRHGSSAHRAESPTTILAAGGHPCLTPSRVRQSTYDPVPARRAQHALELALTRWGEHAALPFDPPYDDPADLEAFTGPAQAYVVEVLAWVRALDDYYLGRQRASPLGRATRKPARSRWWVCCRVHGSQ